MKSKGGERMATTSAKGFSVFILFYVSYIDHIFSPLIWALLVLVTIDVILNVHHEEKQFVKIGSAFATLGGADLFSNTNFFNLNVVHGVVGVLVLAYLQVVVPQLILWVKKLKGLSSTSKAEVIAVLEAENARLKAEAQGQQQVAEKEEQNKVVITK